MQEFKGGNRICYREGNANIVATTLENTPPKDDNINATNNDFEGSH